MTPPVTRINRFPGRMWRRWRGCSRRPSGSPSLRPDKELVSLIKKWMRQDRFGSSSSPQKARDLLIEIKEISTGSAAPQKKTIRPYRAPTNSRQGSHCRRFLSERLPFIRIAREHMTIHDFAALDRVMGPARGRENSAARRAWCLAEHISGRKKKKPGDRRIPDPGDLVHPF